MPTTTKPTVKDLIAEALTWEGTPHKNNQALKGKDGGVDCIRFPCEAAKRAGINVTVPLNYPSDPQGEKLLNYLDEQLYLIGTVRNVYPWSDRYLSRSTTKEQLLMLTQPGDILVFQRTYKGAPGHVELLLDSEYKIHCTIKNGVVKSRLGSAKLLAAVYRFKELR